MFKRLHTKYFSDKSNIPLFILLGIILIVYAYLLLGYDRIHVNSDSAMFYVFYNEQITTHSVFPENWLPYREHYQLAAPVSNLIGMISLLIIKNAINARAFANSILLILLVITMFWCFTKVISVKNSILLTCCILTMCISLHEVFICGNANYSVYFMEILWVFGLSIDFINASGYKKAFWSLLPILILLLSLNSSGNRFISNLSLPMASSLVLFLMFSFSTRQNSKNFWNQMKVYISENKKIFVLITGILITIIIGFLINTNLKFTNKAYQDVLVLTDFKTISNSISTFISGWLKSFSAYYPSAALFSIEGILVPLFFVLMIICTFIIPILLGINYGKLSAFQQVFYLFTIIVGFINTFVLLFTTFHQSIEHAVTWYTFLNFLCSIILLFIYFDRFSVNRVFVFLLFIPILINFFYYSIMPENYPSNLLTRKRNVNLLRTITNNLEEEDVTVGYTPSFWNSHIMTFASDFDVRIEPILVSGVWEKISPKDFFSWKDSCRFTGKNGKFAIILSNSESSDLPESLRNKAIKRLSFPEFDAFIYNDYAPFIELVSSP
ncbi:MAG: hypothetical protein AB9907_12665 [Flexilinea sp.]